MEIRDKTVKFQIWDTAGQEIFHSVNAVYYRNAQGKQFLKINIDQSCIGALVVYDITDVDSFHKMELWVKELRQ